MSKDELPWWKTEGLMIAGGWHPLPGRIRAKIPSETTEEDYAWEYTEEHILRLKELGITLLISQFDRGLGDSDQREQQELARQQAELCHQHGLHHGCYMANTAYFESVLKDNPECEDWVVKTHDGRFVHYGGEQTWRWVACFNSPGWRARMRRQIEIAINHVTTDELHFDNLGVWPEPDSCHCQYCQDAFREFLRQRYPTEDAQKRRFGFTGFDTFRAPNFYLRFIQPWEIDRFQSPVMQEWIDFRCWTVTDYIREMTEYARRLKPDVCIDCNAQSIWGVNQALIHGIDQEAQSAYVDVVCEENPDYRPDDDPRSIYEVTKKMRGMNFYRRLGKQIFTAYRDEESLAFNLTFAGDPGINMQWGYAEPGRAPLNPHQPGVKELLDHYQRHLQLYTLVSSAARTAVWRGKKSLAYVSTDTHLSACVMEHILFTNRIPFSIVQDGYITDEKLSEFDLVILPNVEFVSDEQIGALTRFVENGGALLITERSGTYTAEPRVRKQPGFAPLFGEWTGGPALETYGQGRVAYLPKIDYVDKPHTFKSGHNVHYDSIDSRYWKEPHNAGEVLDAIQWLHPAYQPVRIFGAPEVRLDYVSWSDGSRGVTILRCGELDGPRDLLFAVAAGTGPQDAQLFVPERKAPVALEWTNRQEWLETRLPEVTRHAVVRFR